MSGRARTARVVAVASALAAALLIALPAAPAAAATPNCNIAMVWTNSAGVDLFMPGYDGFPFTPDCLMRQGDVGNDVAQLQSSLNSCYGEHLAVDRVFGPLTRAALVRTQKKVRVAADGVYGPQTRRAMKHRRVGGGACASSL
jgi:hypothetical protein